MPGAVTKGITDEAFAALGQERQAWRRRGPSPAIGAASFSPALESLGGGPAESWRRRWFATPAHVEVRAFLVETYFPCRRPERCGIGTHVGS